MFFQECVFSLTIYLRNILRFYLTKPQSQTSFISIYSMYFVSCRTYIYITKTNYEYLQIRICFHHFVFLRNDLSIFVKIFAWFVCWVSFACLGITTKHLWQSKASIIPRFVSASVVVEANLNLNKRVKLAYTIISCNTHHRDL